MKLQESQIQEAQQALKIDQAWTEFLALIAQLYPFSTAVMQMAKGMTANPDFSVPAMAPLLAVARAILSQELSVKTSIAGIRDTPVSVYSNFNIIPYKKYTPNFLVNYMASMFKFVYYNPAMDKSSLDKDDIILPENYQTDLFLALIDKYIGTRKGSDIFDVELAELDVSKDPSILEIYQLKNFLLNNNFAKDFGSINDQDNHDSSIIDNDHSAVDSKNKDIEKLQALEKAIKYLTDYNLDNLEEIRTPLKLQNLAKKIKSSKYKKKHIAFLNSFQCYISKIVKVVQKIGNIKGQDKVAKAIYDSIFMSQLEDNKRQIRTRKEETLQYGANFIYYVLLCGNVAIFTVLTQNKGEELLKDFLNIADKNLKWKSDTLNTFLKSQPEVFTFLVVAILFSLSTIVISWFFGGASMKNFFKNILKKKNSFEEAYKGKKSKSQKVLVCLLYFAALAIAGCGSNMMLFNYIYFESPFSKAPAVVKFYLMFCIFVSTASFFLYVFEKLRKKNYPEIKSRIIDSIKEKGKIATGAIFFLHFFVIAGIAFALTYILVISDITNASKLFKNLDNCWLITLLLFVGIFTTTFNLFYSSKALNHIHKKLVEMWNPESRQFVNRVLILLSMSMIISTIVLVSLHSNIGTLYFGLIVSPKLKCPV